MSLGCEMTSQPLSHLEGRITGPNCGREDGSWNGLFIGAMKIYRVSLRPLVNRLRSRRGWHGR